MNRVMLAFAITLLCGCGAETATTAATAAAVKKQEIVEGQKLQDQMKARIDSSMQQSRERAEKDAAR